MRRLGLATIVAAMVLAGCSNPSTPMSLEEYFAAVGEAATTYDAAVVEITSDYQAALDEAVAAFALAEDPDGATEGDLVAAAALEVNTGLSRTEAALEELRDRLAELDPPDDVGAEHAEVMASVDVLVGSIGPSAELMTSATSVAELVPLLAGSPFRDALLRFDQSCVSLYEVAVANEIGVDLGCVSSRQPVDAGTGGVEPSQACADVVGVEVTAEGSTYSFAVTIISVETGWEKYADRWEIRGPDGSILGVRNLAHPHIDEQPFTRSLGSVSIPEAVDEVTVAAHDLVDGFCGDTLVVSVPDR